jgi:hypothetical protein
VTAARSRRTLIWQFGQASLAAPLVAWALGCLTGYRVAEGGATAAILIATRWGLLGFGVIAATVALAGVRRYGAKGLLVPGVVGLLLNGGFIALIIRTSALPDPARPGAGNWQPHTSTDGRVVVQFEIRRPRNPVDTPPA